MHLLRCWFAYDELLNKVFVYRSYGSCCPVPHRDDYATARDGVCLLLLPQRDVRVPRIPSPFALTQICPVGWIIVPIELHPSPSHAPVPSRSIDLNAFHTPRISFRYFLYCRYCEMNTWSIANHCAYPDEYDAETKQVNGDGEAVSATDHRGGSAGGTSGAAAGGLLSRGSGGGKQKANGRLSYRDILFNNDGKLRPPYSAGPCASASAGYLFPKPGDSVVSR